MAKFKKGDAVAMLSSWDNCGTVRIRRAIVHSAGSKIMRLQDAKTGEMFKAAYRPEHNVMAAFNGIRIVADATDEALIAEALADGARVCQLNREGYSAKIGNKVFNQDAVMRRIAELHDPVAIWH